MINNKLSFRKLFSINALTVVVSMAVSDHYFGGTGYSANVAAIDIVKKLFLVQLVINLGLLVWFFRSPHNRPLIIISIIVLVAFWLVAFLFFFVTVN